MPCSASTSILRYSPVPLSCARSTSSWSRNARRADAVLGVTTSPGRAACASGLNGSGGSSSTSTCPGKMPGGRRLVGEAFVGVPIQSQFTMKSVSTFSRENVSKTERAVAVLACLLVCPQLTRAQCCDTRFPNRILGFGPDRIAVSLKIGF